MTATSTGYFRFSSDDLRPGDRVPYYRDVVGQMMPCAQTLYAGQASAEQESG